MKTLISHSLLAATIAVFFACNSDRTKDNNYNDNDHPGTEKSAEQHNDAKFDNQNEKDADFVVDAVKHNLNEIALCDLAMQRATHSEIKQLAKQLSEDHTKANNELTALAQKKSITVPSTMDVESSDYKAINDKSGVDFDKAYYDHVVSMHKDAIQRFENAAQDAKDADIRNWASAQLPTLRAHLDRAMDDQKLAETWK
jgi:putative membrane protein